MTVSRIEQRRPFSRGVWELYGSLDIFDAANEERFPIAHLPYIAVVAEVAAIAAIIFGTRRVRQALGGAGKELDIPERIHEAVAQSGMPARVASIVATEFSILYYALAVWRRNPFVPAHAHAFSYHRRSGLVAILYTIWPPPRSSWRHSTSSFALDIERPRTHFSSSTHSPFCGSSDSLAR
jgi:hypothetical protein